jgi:NADH-quinone oxidoreductase subunit C
MTTAAEYDAGLRERFPELAADAISATEEIDMPTILVPGERVVPVLEFVRDEYGFTMLTDLSACDWLGREPRYHINYHLYSLDNNVRLRVKVHLPDVPEPHIPSATSVFPAANWHEREVFDFFGVIFDGHPDLKRILMPVEWIGHPLRKDYPVGGVPVEYRIEPAYVGENVVPREARPAAGGVPVRLRRDRGRMSHMTWSGPPASGVPVNKPSAPDQISEEGKD